MATTIPHAPTPPPPPNPRLDRQTHLKTDLFKALTLIQRSDQVRTFMLDTSQTSDLHLLTTPRPQFTITTEETQAGALPGQISMTYLGIPTFTNQNGLSGGALVTSYKSRTHPLHAPTVMAAVRIGRYLRDNATGDWCFLTRNVRDGLTRIQYIASATCTRERICLTCDSSLFDAGLHAGSVLFQCHDVERRTCHCARFPCTCVPRPSCPPPDLAEAAAVVVREGVSSWAGTVRVTVVADFSGALLNLDECMSVQSRYAPSIDGQLAAHMQRLAIFERTNAATCVPSGLAAPALRREVLSVVTEEEDEQAVSSSVTTDFEDLFEHAGELMWPLALPLDDSFAEEDVVTGFMKDSRKGEVHDEVAMMPADPSTLPGGIELCMEGMDTDCGWYSHFDPSTLHNMNIPTLSPPLSSAQSSVHTPSVLQPPATASKVTSTPTPPPNPKPLPAVMMPPPPPRGSSRLAPRPPGMTASNDEGFVWQMGVENIQTNAHAVAMAAFFEAKEKERKAEERRKKNRQAAARSNARKKGVMDGIRSEIRHSRTRATRLKEIERKLRSENCELKRLLDSSTS